MIVAHLIIGTGLGLSTTAASLLLGQPPSTAFAFYVLAGSLGVIASAMATLLGPMR